MSCSGGKYIFITELDTRDFSYLTPQRLTRCYLLCRFSPRRECMGVKMPRPTHKKLLVFIQQSFVNWLAWATQKGDYTYSLLSYLPWRPDPGIWSVFLLLYPTLPYSVNDLYIEMKILWSFYRWRLFMEENVNVFSVLLVFNKMAAAKGIFQGFM